MAITFKNGAFFNPCPDQTRRFIRNWSSCPQNDVAIAKNDLAAQARSTRRDRPFETRQPIPSAHKVALCATDVGQPVHRYGQVIGFATASIARVVFTTGRGSVFGFKPA